ncbi:hypothetical protein MHYP_G00245790 [Metynnis hypsauchen]
MRRACSLFSQGDEHNDALARSHSHTSRWMRAETRARVKRRDYAGIHICLRLDSIRALAFDLSMVGGSQEEATERCGLSQQKWWQMG